MFNLPMRSGIPRRPHSLTVSPVAFDEANDDMTTAQTPSSAAEGIDIESPATAATTPRTKFPSDLKTLACPWPDCPKSFNRPARLRDHLNSHTNSRPFKCPYDDCDKDYIEDKHLKQHVKAAHTNERKYVCQVEGCGKSFVTGTRLKRHQAVHEGADRFRCQDCGQSFRKRETLTKHVRKEHMGMRAYACAEPECEESFDSKPALKRHREREHGEIKFWCTECAMTMAPDGNPMRVGFTTEHLLQAHLKKEHQNCLFCDYKPASRWDLDQHVEMHHSGKSIADRKTHPCTYAGCDKKFTKKSNLRTHVRTAHEGFRFVCGEVTLSGPEFDRWSNDQGCGDKFSTKVRLEDHVRFIHLGEERPRLGKPDYHNDNSDELCETNLIDDISGVARFAKQTIPCQHCTLAFSRYHDLAVHLHNEHGDLGSSNPLLLVPLDTEMFPAPTSWPEDMDDEEEIFASTTDYRDHTDEWPEDEANMMLLAREADSNSAVDPALSI